MGFSTNGAAAILFVAAFMAVGMLVPAAQAGFEDVSSSWASQENRVVATTNTAISLSNVTYNNTSDTLTVRAENTGTTTLHVADTDVLVDGEMTTPNATVAGVSGRSIWAPGENATFTLSRSSAPSRVVVVTEHAVSVGTNDIVVVS